MVERMNGAEEAISHRLGVALTMERTVLEMLEHGANDARNAKVASFFRRHRHETAQHGDDLERVLAALDWGVGGAACPAIAGLREESERNARSADASVVDAVLLMGAMETEHYEMAVYESLIVALRGMGRHDVVPLLQRTLEQEERALSDIKSALHRVTPLPSGRQGVRLLRPQAATG